MGKMMRIAINKSLRNEKGQALIIVLIVLLMGGLITAPLLNYMGTGLIAVQANEERTAEFYAADAGVEDALWLIKADASGLPEIDVDPWVYTMGDMNGKQVTVEVASVWILDGIEDPVHGQTPHAELLAVGRVTDPVTGQYEVEVYYDGSIGNVRVDRVGVWLPIDFGYGGSSSGMTTDDPVPGPPRGGLTLIWDFNPPILFKNKVVTTKSQYFSITPPGDPEGDFAWVRTTRNDIYLSWDGENVSYIVTATAIDSATGKQTEAVAYTFRDSAAEVGLITWEISRQ